MFDYNELDVLANNAKKQLQQQGEDVNFYEGINDYEDSDSKDIDYDDLYDISRSEYQGEEDLPVLNKFDELLFPGGPSKNEIDIWKKDWQGYEIYITEILNQTFIFRTLNRFEYKQLISLTNVDALQREEVICQTVTLWPQEYTWKEMATTLAGIPSTYAEIIMEKSGFTKDYAIQVL